MVARAQQRRAVRRHLERVLGVDWEMVYLITVRTYRTRPHRIMMNPRATATCIVLLLATGCPKQPEFGMEAPGRPALTWQHDDTDSTEKPVTDAAQGEGNGTGAAGRVP